MTTVEQSSLANSVDNELSKARDSLRRIDDDIRLLTGRNAEDLANRFGKGRNRFSTDTAPRNDSEFGRGPRSVVRAEGGAGTTGLKRRITYGERSLGDSEEGLGDDGWKKPRIASEYSRTSRLVSDSSDSGARSAKPVVQSSVTMPLKEVKSREEAISELKGTEKTEVSVRNRRMFGMLLGTLQKFKKDEEKHTFKDQEKKQKEIEARLEEAKRSERAQMEKERQKLLDKRRRQEQDLRRLQRKRALIAATDNQVALLKRLQNFIQTTTKPPIFFMPARHTIRTIELQKKSQKRLEEIIKAKQEEMEAQLKEMDEGFVAPMDDDDDEHEHEHEEAPAPIASMKPESEQSDVAIKQEELSFSVDQESKGDTETAPRDGNATNGDEATAANEKQEDEGAGAEPVKSKDIQDELKELTADYAEELNFEDDEQQRPANFAGRWKWMGAIHRRRGFCACLTIGEVIVRSSGLQCPNNGTNLDLQCDALCKKGCWRCSEACLRRLVRPRCEGQTLARALLDICPSTISPVQACYTACTCCRTDVIACAEECAKSFALEVYKKWRVNLLI